MAVHGKRAGGTKEINFATVQQMSDRNLTTATRYPRVISDEEQFAKGSYLKTPVHAINLCYEMSTLFMGRSYNSEDKPIIYAELKEIPINVEEKDFTDMENKSFEIGIQRTINSKKKKIRRKKCRDDECRIISVSAEEVNQSGRKLTKIYNPLQGKSSNKLEESARINFKGRIKEYRKFIDSVMFKKVKKEDFKEEAEKFSVKFKTRVQRTKKEMAKLKTQFRKYEDKTQNFVRKNDYEWSGDEERDFGGGPFGTTSGGMKQQSFDSMFFKERGIDYRYRFRKHTKEHNVSGRKKKRIIRTNFKVDFEYFEQADLLFLKHRQEEIIAKIEKKHKENKIDHMIFFTRVYLILIQACRLKLLDIVKYFVTSFSEYFNIDRIFVYSYHKNIGYLPKNWFLDIGWHYPTDETYPVGNALLHIASNNLDFDMIKYLVEEQNAAIDVQDCCGRTPLMLVLCNLPLIKYFISKKANVNHQTIDGLTPLMLLSKTCYNKDSIMALLDAGADPTIIDKCGRSAINYFMSVFGFEALELIMKPEYFPDTASGYLSYAGHKLFLQVIHIQHINCLLLVSHVSIRQKISLMFLYVCQVIFADQLYRQIDKVKQCMTEALEYASETGMVFQYPKLIESYDFRREPQNTKEFEELISSSTNSALQKIELAFMGLIISDRICGVYSCSSVGLHRMTLEFLNSYNSRNRDKDGEEHMVKSKALTLKMLEYYLERIKIYMTVCGPTKESKEIISHGSGCIYSISLTNRFKMKYYRERLLKIYANAADALVTYLKFTSHLHIHHELYEISDDRMVFHWTESLLRKKKLVKMASIRKRFFKNCNFIFQCKGVPTSLMNLMGRMSDCNADIMMEFFDLAGHDLINTPSNGTYPLIFLTSLSHKCLPRIVKNGGHLDSVDYAGLSAEYQGCSSSRYNMMLMYSNKRDDSLSCISARTVVFHKIPYLKMDLPAHIKEFISLHDPETHDRQYRKHLRLPPNNYQTD